jgi:hypothetical protein
VWWASGKLPRDIAQSVLAAWIEGLPVGRPGEPWTVAHVAERLDRAYEKRAKLPRAFEVVTTQAPATPQEKAESDARVLAAVNGALSARDFGKQNKETVWLCPDFVSPGCYTEIIGLMKKGKSTLVCTLLRSLTTGEDFLGRKVMASPVVYVTEQVGSSLRATLERGRLLDTPDLFLLTTEHLLGMSWAEKVRASIMVADRIGARVLVYDTIHRLAGLTGDRENQAGTINEIIQPCEEAKAKKLAVIFVRHARKNSGDGDDVSTAGRGSGSFTGEMDICVLHQDPWKDHPNLRRLQIISRLSEVDDTCLEYQDGLYVVGEAPKGRKDFRDKHRKILEVDPHGTMTVRELVKATGFTKATVERHRREAQQGFEVQT